MPEADYRLMTEATGQRIAAALENLSGFGDYLTTADVVNNLTSTVTNKPGSANMLRELNERIDSKQTLTATTDSNGRIISNINFADVKSVNVASKIDYYALCRQSTQGKAVFLVFNGGFQIAANTSVDLLIWMA